jgi:hypothetical protein
VRGAARRGREWVQRRDAENAEISAEKQRLGEKGKDWIVEEADKRKAKTRLGRKQRAQREEGSELRSEWDGKAGKKNAPTNGGMAA